MLQPNKNAVWLSVLVITLSINYVAKIHAQEINQDSRKIVKARGKFLLLKGYVLHEDTLIARTPQAEKRVAKFYAEFEECLDKVDLLVKKNDLQSEDVDLLKNIVKRKNYVIVQQDSLLLQLEKIAKPPHPIVKFLRKVFKPEVTLILGFIAGIYAGIGVK